MKTLFNDNRATIIVPCGIILITAIINLALGFDIPEKALYESLLLFPILILSFFVKSRIWASILSIPLIAMTILPDYIGISNISFGFSFNEIIELDLFMLMLLLFHISKHFGIWKVIQQFTKSSSEKESVQKAVNNRFLKAFESKSAEELEEIKNNKDMDPMARRAAEELLSKK